MTLKQHYASITPRVSNTSNIPYAGQNRLSITPNVTSLGGLGKIDDTPSNLLNDEEQRRRFMVGNDIINASNTLLETGKNVDAKNQKYANSYTAANKADTFIVNQDMLTKAGLNYSSEHLTQDQTHALQQQIEELQQANRNTSHTEQSAKPVNERITSSDWYSVTKNKDGTSTVTSYGVWDKILGRTVGEGYSTTFTDDARSAQKMLSIMNGFNSSLDNMNDSDRVTASIRTISEMLDVARGGAGENILDSNGITTIANAIDYANHVKDMDYSQKAMQGLSLINQAAGQLGYEIPALSNAVSMYTAGYGVYELLNNWDKLDPSQRGALFMSSLVNGALAYEPAKNLVTTFQQAWNNVGIPSTGAQAVSTGGGQIASAGGGAAASGGEKIMTSSVGSSTGGAQVGNASSSVGTSMGTQVGASAVTRDTATSATQAAWNNGANEATRQAGQELASQQGASEGTQQMVNAGSSELATDQAIEQGSKQSGSSMGLSFYLAALAAFIDHGWNKNYGMFRHGNDVTTMAKYDYELLKNHVGSGTNDDRKVLAARGTQIGTTIGAFWGPAGAAIGGAIGVVVGMGLGSFKTGHSVEQKARDSWRYQFATRGIFRRTGDDKYAMRLADGRYYSVDADGSGSRATYIDGSVKEFANPDKLTEGDAHRIVNKQGEARKLLPYEVDYTNDLDFTGNIMVTPLIMAVGGSYNLKKTGELGQMLGLMTNGITSNCGREFTPENFGVMTSNVRALFATQGITNKSLMNNSLAEAYFSGILSKKDYQLGLMAQNWIFDEDGFDQAAGVMNSSRGSNIGMTGGRDVTASQNNFVQGDTRGIA